MLPGPRRRTAPPAGSAAEFGSVMVTSSCDHTLFDPLIVPRLYQTLVYGIAGVRAVVVDQLDGHVAGHR